MSITSLVFFISIFVASLCYFVVPKNMRWMVLLTASIVFVLSNSSWELLVIALIPIMLTYVAAIIIEQCNIKQTNNKKALLIKNIVLLTTILFDVGILIYYKELNFFLNIGNSICNLFNLDYSINLISGIIAPLGISYFILTLIGYLLDVNWMKSSAQKNPLKFVLFGIYFPVITSGPIIRYDEIKTSLYDGNLFDYDRICFGLQRILWGLFKKLVIAERISIIVSTIQTEKLAGLYVFIGILLYAIQVYMDFSGCMDIVLGVSEIFGIYLPENFQTPLYARDLSEFWRRWHITLGAWVRDYVLYPVLKSNLIQKIGKKTKKKFGKKLGKKIPTWIGMLVVWLTVGFWHGGAWTFIFGSGLFFFIMIVGGQILEPLFAEIIKKLKINTESAVWVLFQRVRTFVLFSSSISFSWAPSMSEGVAMWKRGFSTYNPKILFDGSLLNLGLDIPNFIVMILGLMVVFVVSYLQQSGSVRKKIKEKTIIIRWSLYICLLFSVLILGMYGPGYDASEFIYGQF